MGPGQLGNARCTIWVSSGTLAGCAELFGSISATGCGRISGVLRNHPIRPLAVANLKKARIFLVELNHPPHVSLREAFDFR